MLFFWGFAVLVGVLLSAPFFTNPPESIGGWSVRVPAVLKWFLIVSRMVPRLGFTILRLIWLGIAQVRGTA
jgi:hypothetical protein